MNQAIHPVVARNEVIWPPKKSTAPLPGLWDLVSSIMVVTLFSPLAILTSPLAHRVALGLVLLDIPLQLDTHLLFRESAEEYGSLVGINLSVTTVALAFLYLGWILERHSSLAKGAYSRRQAPPGVAKWLFVVLCLLIIHSLVVPGDVQLAFFQVTLLAQMFLVFFYVASNVLSRKDVLFVVIMLLAGAVAEGMVMGALWMRGESTTILGTNARVDADPSGTGEPRIGGTVGSPNNAGAYFSFLLPLAMSVWFAHVRRRYKVLSILVLLAGLPSLVLTQSRGAWMAFVVAMLLLFGIVSHSSRRARRLALILAAVVALALVAQTAAISDRVTGDDQGAAAARFPLMVLSFRMIADHPFLGVGVNNHALEAQHYANGQLATEWFFTVHNKFLLIWTELGIGGLLAFLWFLYLTLRWAWQGIRAADPLLSPLAAGLLVAVIGHMVHMNGDVFNGRPMTQLLFVASALVFGIHRLTTQRNALPLRTVETRAEPYSPVGSGIWPRRS